MKNIHFFLMNNFPGYSKLINVSQVRSYLTTIGIDAKITYQDIKSSKTYINDLYPGKRVTDIPDLDHIVQLINNYYNNESLLYNIPITDIYKNIINQIDSCYNKKLDYDCICFSCFSPFVFLIIYASFLIKKNNPNIDIMVGGIQIRSSKNTKDIFNNLDVIDYILTGDIEVAIEKYLTDEIPNKSYFVGYTDMPKIDVPKFYKAELSVSNYLLLNTSRSCPYSCSFCSGGIEPTRHQSTDIIIKTIKSYNRSFKIFNPKIYFTDNTFNFTKKRIHKICDGLIDINNKIPLDAYLVYNHIDHEIIRKMKKANFKIIRIGLDAFAEEKRYYTKKNFKITKEEIIDIADCIASNQMENQIFLIFGMPNESPDSFNIDFNLTAELNLRDGVTAYPFFYGLTSGSDIYNNPKEYGVTFEYWETIRCVIPEINDIVNRTPKFYFCDVSPEQYINQWKRLRSQLIRDNSIFYMDDGWKSTTLELEKLMKEELL